VYKLLVQCGCLLYYIVTQILSTTATSRQIPTYLCRRLSKFKMRGYWIYYIIKKTFISVNFFLNDSCFKDEVPLEYLSHQEKYEIAIRKSFLALKKIIEWEKISNSTFLEIVTYVLAYF